MYSLNHIKRTVHIENETNKTAYKIAQYIAQKLEGNEGKLLFITDGTRSKFNSDLLQEFYTDSRRTLFSPRPFDRGSAILNNVFIYSNMKASDREQVLYIRPKFCFTNYPDSNGVCKKCDYKEPFVKIGTVHDRKLKELLSPDEIAEPIQWNAEEQFNKLKEVERIEDELKKAKEGILYNFLR